MYNFLAQPNTIVHLDLSNTECSLDMVMPLSTTRALTTPTLMGWRPVSLVNYSHTPEEEMGAHHFHTTLGL